MFNFIYFLSFESSKFFLNYQMEEFDIKNKILKECIKCNNIPLYGLIPENNDLKIFSKCNCGKKIIRNNYHEQMFKKYNKELNKLKENQKCLIHNKEIYSICYECEKEICEDCYVEECKNKNHKLELWNNLIKDNIENGTMNKLTIAYNNFIKKSEEAKNKILTELENRIKTIKKNFEINKEINDKLFEIVKIIYNTYKLYKEKNNISYPIIYNLLKLPSSNEFYYSIYANMNIKDFYNYLNNNFFLKPTIIEFPNFKTIHSSGYHTAINSFLELNQLNKYISSSNDGYIKIYNENFNVIFTEKIHNSGISLIKLSNGNFISSSKDKSVKIFQVNENNLNILQIIDDFEDNVLNSITLKNELYLLSCLFKSLKIFKRNDENKYIYKTSFETSNSLKIEKINENLFLKINQKNIIIYELIEKNETLYLNEKKVYNINVYISNSQNFQLINQETIGIISYNFMYIISLKTYEIITKIKCNSNSCSIKVLKDGTLICAEIDKVEQFSLISFEKLMNIKLFDYDFVDEYDDYFQNDNIILFINEFSNGIICACYRNCHVEFWKNK